MTLDVTQEELDNCKAELESLTKFSHDNKYVGMLIADRVVKLQQNIKIYEQMINSRT